MFNQIIIVSIFFPDLGGGSIGGESCSSFYCSALIINHHPHFLLLLSFLLFVLSICDKRGGYISVHANENSSHEILYVSQSYVDISLCSLYFTIFFFGKTYFLIRMIINATSSDSRSSTKLQ